MLSPRDDDEDDNHLCIKCNATIVGLDNYIKHRKERCGKNKSETKTGLPIDSLEPTYSLGADVFFQSLELQSSVKKTSLSRLTPPTSISKTALDRKSTLTVASTSRDLARISPVETNLRGVDWIGGHSIRIGSNEDNQTKLINAVASISGNVKKDLPSSSYNIGTFNDFKGDDDSDDCEESEDDEEEESGHGSKWKPPPHYTGGKWRPASPEHLEWDIREEHMGGKWKSLVIPESNEREEDYDAPPPGHTKGKWVPGEKTQIMQTTIQNKGSVQYWCGPCNRRLGSRAVYDKHLMSNLHMRKVLPEHELEFSGHLEPLRNINEKRTTRPSRFVNNSIYLQPQRKKQKITDTKLSVTTVKTKRKRRPCFLHCSVCKSRVRYHLMGKHLISHYHFRKATDTQSPTYQQLILDNIHVIVHQSPFQCSPCRFYTNWSSNFMQHWFSDEHKSKTDSMEGRYWCSFCKFECESSDEMVNHISGPEHSEVVAVINRSMPIILRKKTILKCDTCSKEFRYNMEIKQHCRRTGHELCHTATDAYQELHKCQHCKEKFKSSLTLAAHLKSKHKQRAYFCLVCSKTFNSSSEAKQHRQTSEHRVRRKEILIEKGFRVPVKDLSKKCPYCIDNVRLKNIIELKDHIRRVHPNIKKKCSKCGMSFILSQEVTRHIRSKACQYQNASSLSAPILWNCSQCLFTTDSQAECFFHEVLHSPSITKVTKGEKDRLIEKYDCPLCPKSFTKASLRHHLKQHTFERPFVCNICGANFTRQSSLTNHSRSEHANNSVTKISEPSSIDATADTSMTDLKCGHCKKKFTNKTALTQHETSCSSVERRCPHDQCTFVASTASQLIRHRRAHGENIKNHKCSVCTFSSDQASHMKRHMMCHEGLKPYACPHCPFTCGSLENLRKHVLRSGRHEGLYLYECPECKYKTNMATDLRTHYTVAHPDKYNPKTALQAVKTHLMKNITREEGEDEK